MIIVYEYTKEQYSSHSFVGFYKEVNLGYFGAKVTQGILKTWLRDR